MWKTKKEEIQILVFEYKASKVVGQNPYGGW